MDERDAIKAVFAIDADENTLQSRVSSSRTQFARTQYEIEIAEPKSKGIKIDASSALRHYGWNVLRQLAEYSSASVTAARGEPYKTIEERLSSLGLTLETVAKLAGWNDEDLRKFRDRKPIEVRKLDRISSYLALQLEQLGRTTSSGVNILVRLKELRDDGSFSSSPGDELGLSLPVYATLLARHTEVFQSHPDLGTSFDYSHKEIGLGNFIASARRTAKEKAGNNPIVEGKHLAVALRQYLQIGPEQPVTGLSRIVEDKLGILLFKRKKTKMIAGLTIASEKSRAIAVDRSKGQSIYFARSVLAHELCHALFDSKLELLSVTADPSTVFEARTDRMLEGNYIETRANAFSAEFLAPAQPVQSLFSKERRPHVALMRVAQHFGISLTAAYFQVLSGESDVGLLDALERAKRTHTHAVPLDEHSYSTWVRSEQTASDDFFRGLRSIETIRKNRLSLAALRLFACDSMTLDQLISILGYPRISVDTLLGRLKRHEFAGRKFSR